MDALPHFSGQPGRSGAVALPGGKQASGAEGGQCLAEIDAQSRQRLKTLLLRMGVARLLPASFVEWEEFRDVVAFCLSMSPCKVSALGR